MIFLLKWWREIGIAVLAIFLVAACHARDTALTERGRALEKVRVADSALKVLRPALARTDTLLVRDTLRLTKLRTELATVHDTVLLHLTDTLIVKAYIEKADSTVQACTDLLNSCALFRSQATATIAALEAKTRALPVADRRSCVSSGLVGGLVGLGAGFLGARIVR